MSIFCLRVCGEASCGPSCSRIRRGRSRLGGASCTGRGPGSGSGPLPQRPPRLHSLSSRSSPFVSRICANGAQAALAGPDPRGGLRALPTRQRPPRTDSLRSAGRRHAGCGEMPGRGWGLGRGAGTGSLGPFLPASHKEGSRERGGSGSGSAHWPVFPEGMTLTPAEFSMGQGARRSFSRVLFRFMMCMPPLALL